MTYWIGRRRPVLTVWRLSLTIRRTLREVKEHRAASGSRLNAGAAARHRADQILQLTYCQVLTILKIAMVQCFGFMGGCAALESNARTLRGVAATFSPDLVAELVSYSAAFGWFDRWSSCLRTDLETVPYEFDREHLEKHGW